MKLTVTRAGALTSVKLKGKVDEAARDWLKALEAELTTPAVVLDCQDVLYFNSVGVNAWIKFFDAAGKTCRLTFVNCSSIFASMVCMTSAFVGGGKILSLYLPYECRSCRKVGDELVLATEYQNGEAPEKKCQKCGQMRASILDVPTSCLE